MELFVLRHGDAEPLITNDQARCLTPRGWAEVQTVMDAACEKMKSLELILVSPYVRAQQTADIVQEKFPSVKTETTLQLIPEGDISELYELLQGCSEKSVLLVSHQPLVGTIVNGLSGKGGSKNSGYYAMGTANLASIDCDVVAPGCGELQWLKRPED